MTRHEISTRGAKQLFDLLDNEGVIASIEDRGGEDRYHQSDEYIQGMIADNLRGFLSAHWPDVQLIETYSDVGDPPKGVGNDK
jgi:hypothetical protein